MRRLCHISARLRAQWETHGRGKVRGQQRNRNNLWHCKASQIPDTKTHRAQNKVCRIVADANSSRGIALRDGRLQGESESGSFQLSWMQGRVVSRHRRLYTPFNAQSTIINNQPDLGSQHSRNTPRLDRCLALTLEQSLTESRPRVRIPRGCSAPQVVIKMKPTATPSRRPASPRFDTYSLAIPAFYLDIVRSQTGMISRLRPHARRRPLQKKGL